MSRRNTCPKNGDGLDAANIQPAKTLTKHTAYFIGKCNKLTTGFTLDRGIDLSFIAWCVVVVVAVLMGVFQ